MSEMSVSARKAMKDKASRYCQADPHKKVDASSWKPEESLETSKKKMPRPINPREYKRGGKVHGEETKQHAGKKPRAKKMDGGGMDPRAAAMAELASSAARSGVPANRMAFQPKASIPLPGSGMNKGGEAKRKGHKDGGDVKGANYLGGTRPTGGRIARKSGGKTKGKTNINIVIAPGRGEQSPMQGGPGMPPPARPVAVPPPAPPPGMPGMPPGGPPPMGGAPPMPMPSPMARKRGGKAYRSFRDMDAGGLGGKARLEKAEIQEHKR